MRPPAPIPKPRDPPARQLLDWYDRHRRHLPWRAAPGETADPYRVWLSEIMLQQTTVVTAARYFGRFLERWPDVAALAAADLDAVLAAWAGLGYYARARNLHRCAAIVAREHGGCFPDSEAGLRALPGIGAYTAAAIAAIAFDRPAAVLDGNGERVMARLRAIDTPLPAAKPALRAAAAALTPADRPGDYAQAVMDLGAMICTPRRPKCALCPWREDCAGHAAGIAASLPRKRPRPARPVRRGAAFWCTAPDGRVLLRRRPDDGLLGGMMEVPCSRWSERRRSEAELLAEAPLAADWQRLPGLVRHGFTHFALELAVFSARAAPVDLPGGSWHAVAALGTLALPTAFAKVVRHAERHGGGTGASVPEVPHPGKDHGEAAHIGGGDHLFVAD